MFGADYMAGPGFVPPPADIVQYYVVQNTTYLHSCPLYMNVGGGPRVVSSSLPCVCTGSVYVSLDPVGPVRISFASLLSHVLLAAHELGHLRQEVWVVRQLHYRSQPPSAIHPHRGCLLVGTVDSSHRHRHRHRLRFRVCLLRILPGERA